MRNRILLVLVAFLVILGCIMVASVKDDTLTTDESLYIATGYRALTTGNLRYGFEHPPLMRDLAALPLLALDLESTDRFINFGNPDLTAEVWNFGDRYVYQQNVSPEKLLLFSRVPMILMTLAFLLVLYLALEPRYGWQTAGLTVGLLGFSPLLLAHGRLVTLDVPSAFGVFVTLYFFTRFLERRDRRSILLAGAALAFAQLIKFSLLTLVPFLVVFVAGYVWFEKKQQWKEYLKGTAAVFGIAFLGIGLVYAFHLFNYPKELQASDARYVFSATRPYVSSWIAQWISWFAEQPVLRPWAQYLSGAAWQLSRNSAYGYFMGEGSFSAWRLFYPVGYFLKLPLAFHALTVLALVLGVLEFRAVQKKDWRSWLSKDLFVLLSAFWIAWYGFILIFLNAGNTGTRYLLPVLPFICLFISLALVRWFRTETARGAVRPLQLGFVALVIALVPVSVLRSYPSFISYFNELVAPEKASHYLVDTDVDWGQDVKRLDQWLRRHQINKVKFAQTFQYRDSAGRPSQGWVYSNSYKYYLGTKMEPLVPGVKTSGWLALPARALRWGQTSPAAKNGWSSDSYEWLKRYQPITLIGNSIYVYYVE